MELSTHTHTNAILSITVIKMLYVTVTANLYAEQHKSTIIIPVNKNVI